MPLSVQMMLSMVSSPSTYHKGADYCRQKRVTLLQTQPGMILSEVRGSGDRAYTVVASYTPDGSELADYGCSCPAFAEYEGICKHIVATLLQHQKTCAPAPQQNWDARPDQASDPAACQLLRRYARQIADRALAFQEANARLQATLEIRPDGGRLSFKVGAERLYVVQDLERFYRYFAYGETASYGKHYALQHHPSSFEPESLPLLHFFLQYYNEAAQCALAQQRFYTYGNSKRYLHLEPRALDELVVLFEDGELWVDDDKDRVLAQVARGKFRPSLRLVRDGPRCLLESTKPYRTLLGAQGAYVLEGKTLHVCSEEFLAACGEMLQALEQARGALHFSSKDTTALFANILNPAEPYMDLEIEEGLNEFQPPKLQARLYLDTEGADDVTAYITFTYGEHTHKAFSDKDLRQSHDIGGEFLAENLLLKYFPGPPDETGRLRIQSDPEAVYRLVCEGVAELEQYVEVFASETYQKIRVHPGAAVRVGVRVESGILQLDFELEGVDLAELSDILDSYRKAKKYHRLRAGAFLTLEEGALSRLTELADGLDLSEQQLAEGRAELALNRALYLDAMVKRSEGILYDRDRAFKGIVRGMRDVADADFEVPEPLRAVLRNYQKTGYRWLRTLDAYGFGGVLADDMGLGKTLQVLALLLACKNREGERLPSVVVCPASLALNWENETQRFTPELRVAALGGTAAERAQTIARAGELDLLVTSYDLLKRDVALYENLRFAFIIVDEAQYIKNPGTQNAKAAKLLRGNTRLALTGTPVENNLAELWSIFDFLMPGYLLSYAKFRKRYEEPIVREKQSEAAERLRQLVRPFMLRRLKSEVLAELPPKMETVLRFAMEEKQRALYLATLARAKQDLSVASTGKDRFAVLAALTRMRQICCDPALLFEDYEGGSVKLEACIELVQSCAESGRRMLLFSQFTSMLAIISDRLDAMGLSYFKLEGATKPSRRIEMVNAFNAGTVPVFLISLKAGGTGLNLTGADVVIHYDPWWNLSAQNQATDRAHRIGQKSSVQVYKLIVRDTVEERILEMQQKKAALADQIIQEGGDVFASMDQDELLALFER